jgi:hypothetical protein
MTHSFPRATPVVRNALLAFMTMGLVCRLAAAFLLPDQSAYWSDVQAYRVLGHIFWTTGEYTSPIYMPLYPILAGISETRWPTLIIDIGLSTILIWLTYQLTVALFADTAAALLAALAVALYPQFIVFAVLGLTEPLFMTLFIAAFVFWCRGYFVAAAICAVLSILTRPAIDLLAPILVVYFAVAIHRMPVAGAVRQLAIYAIIYCALMAPWWVHNYHAYGAFVRLNVAGGENFYAGNNPRNKSGGGLKDSDFVTTEFDGIRSPVEREAALFKAGVEYIKADPKAFVERMWVKFGRFWRLWPSFDQYSKPFYIAIYIFTYVPIFVMTLVYLGLWGVREFFRIVPVLMFAGYLTLVNVVMVASIRYRMPLEPFMIVFAATATVRLLRRWPAGNSLLERLGASPAMS